MSYYRVAMCFMFFAVSIIAFIGLRNEAPILEVCGICGIIGLVFCMIMHVFVVNHEIDRDERGRK